MIYKKQGCIELEKLRVIHLMEADFNLAIGILFGRRAIITQIKDKHLHKGQFGKPGGECQDVAYTKLLHYQMSHFSQTRMASFDSDAALCFDRIVMNFALVCFKV